MAFLRQRVHACEPGTVEYVQVAGLAVSETANPTEQGQKIMNVLFIFMATGLNL